MPIIPSGPAYRAGRALTPRVFKGAGEVSVDFLMEVVSGNIYRFTPVVTGDVSEFEWDPGDESGVSGDVVLTHDYGSGTARGLWSGDETSADSVNGNDAIWRGGSGAYSPGGVVNQCFTLGKNPNTNYLEIPASEALTFEPGDKFELSFFYNTGAPRLWDGRITLMMWSNDKAGNGRSFYVEIGEDSSVPAGGSAVYINILTPYHYQKYSYVSKLLEFAHARIIYDNGRVELYVNDILRTPDAGYQDMIIAATSGKPIFIYSGSYQYFSYIDEFKISKSPISATLRVKSGSAWYSKTKELSV